MSFRSGLYSLFGPRSEKSKAKSYSKLPEAVSSFRSKPKLVKSVDHGFNSSLTFKDTNNMSVSINLYRFLRDAVPILNSAIWTWSAMSASPIKIEFKGVTDEDRANAVVSNLFDRIYDQRCQRFAEIHALLLEYFNSLYTTGIVCGEVVATPELDGVDYFYFIDPASLEFKFVNGHWKIYQNQNNRKVELSSPSIYFYGLNADSINPGGRSLLKSIPFVARVEQQLLSDMHKSMHNAGYHRLHIKVRPPDKNPGESDESYLGRANTYFEKTASMFTDFRPEDNPITWDDIQIDYIGPSSQVSASRSWYLNHKALLEDICAGTHLAPFMLGYSYGTTQNWAMFKYELVQRQVRAIQAAASGFLQWMAELEMAFQGISGRCRISFENDVIYGINEKSAADHQKTETVIIKYNAGLIDREEARRELNCR